MHHHYLDSQPQVVMANVVVRGDGRYDGEAKWC